MYPFINQQDLEKLQPLHRFEESNPIRVTRRFRRSSSDDPFDPLPLDANELELAYMLSDVFLHKTANVETFSYLYDRLRKLSVNLRQHSTVYDELLLMFTSLALPLYLSVSLPTSDTDFGTYQTQNFYWLYNEMISQNMNSSDQFIRVLCGQESTHPLYLQVTKHISCNNDEEALNLIIQSLMLPSTDACVASSLFLKLFKNESRLLQYKQLVQRIPVHLLSQNFIIESLKFRFPFIFSQMNQKIGTQLTWNPTGIVSVQLTLPKLFSTSNRFITPLKSFYENKAVSTPQNITESNPLQDLRVFEFQREDTPFVDTKLNEKNSPIIGEVQTNQFGAKIVVGAEPKFNMGAFGLNIAGSGEKKDEPKSTFNLGETKTFNFGGEKKEETKTFNFGEKKEEVKPAFNFGENKTEPKLDAKPTFNFGQKETVKPTFTLGEKKEETKPTFNFGQKEEKKTDQPQFVFGQPKSQSQEPISSNKSDTKPNFAFVPPKEVSEPKQFSQQPQTELKQPIALQPSFTQPAQYQNNSLMQFDPQICVLLQPHLKQLQQKLAIELLQEKVNEQNALKILKRLQVNISQNEENIATVNEDQTIYKQTTTTLRYEDEYSGMRQTVMNAFSLVWK
ncbi:Conserved_hypothetical protein [Hexamita inflata]|uniref:Uncharacterized protein n=1 Tax=Hexamita inflata TaxID=28002 RepID=A0AA86RKP4_9EUKA|nr:Conserved hypothetical protein [Hexamita inflata]